MIQRSRLRILVPSILVLGLLLAACGQTRGGTPTAEPAAEAAESDLGSEPSVLLAAADAEPRLPESREAPSLARVVADVAWTPFATIGELVLHHPSARVEVVAFHEANHDGAQQMDVASTAVEAFTLDSRERGTGSRSAADIVVEPGVDIRAPVTGTVLRAGSYVLYCRYDDGYVIIEPDGWPGWEVKVLHIDGVAVEAGDRVIAGESVLAGGPTPLPFESQVDEHTAEPSWPHVHIEVVDTSIPREPSSGGGC